MNMFSWEINKLLLKRHYLLSYEDYKTVTDIVQNPQINNIKYNPYDDNFSLSTIDGFLWTFKVIR